MRRSQPFFRTTMSLLAVALGLSACSRGADEEGQAANAEAFAALFDKGFADAAMPPRSAEPVVSDYEPDPRVRRETASAFAANLRRNFSLTFAASDPEQFLRSGAAGDIADRKLEALGLPTGSLAGATVLMFGLAWELANQRMLTPQDQQALLRQMTAKVDAGAAGKRSAVARQQDAEIRLLTAALWLEEARLRENSPERMRELSDAVQRDMKRLSGNDMRAHSVSDEGFVDR